MSATSTADNTHKGDAALRQGNRSRFDRANGLSLVASLFFGALVGLGITAWLEHDAHDFPLILWALISAIVWMSFFSILVRMNGLEAIDKGMTDLTGVGVDHANRVEELQRELKTCKAERDEAQAQALSESCFTRPQNLDGGTYSLGTNRAQYNLTIFRVVDGALRDGTIVQINPPERGNHLRLGLVDGLSFTYQVPTRDATGIKFSLPAPAGRTPDSVRFEHSLPDGETFLLGDRLVVVDYDVLSAGSNLHAAKVRGTVWYEELMSRTRLSKGITSSSQS